MCLTLSLLVTRSSLGKGVKTNMNENTHASDDDDTECFEGGTGTIVAAAGDFE